MRRPPATSWRHRWTERTGEPAARPCVQDFDDQAPGGSRRPQPYSVFPDAPDQDNPVPRRCGGVWFRRPCGVASGRRPTGIRRARALLRALWPSDRRAAQLLFLGRPTLLLVLRRLARPGLVLVRLWRALWLRLGRRPRMARLAPFRWPLSGRILSGWLQRRLSPLERRPDRVAWRPRRLEPWRSWRRRSRTWPRRRSWRRSRWRSRQWSRWRSWRGPPSLMPPKLGFRAALC